jgi:hypothetical protein
MLNWQDLLPMSDVELSAIDIAEMNLACAQGLPGSEAIETEFCLKTLDKWTEIVKRWTDAAYKEYFLHDPAQFQNSETYFRIVALTTALQRHCGVRYDPAKSGLTPDDGDFEFHESFVHGVIQGPGGTCATLPVVYASIGRRLGYPIRLACTRHHLFARWDDPLKGMRLNFEGTKGGYSIYTDHHYRRWPKPIKDEDEKAFGLLVSFTPKRELAHFIAQRGFVFSDHHQFLEAVRMHVLAAEICPQYADFPRCVATTLRNWDARLKSQLPQGFPRHIEMRFPLGWRQWPSVPFEVDRAICRLMTTEWILNHPVHREHWWEPLRQGRKPLSEVPISMSLDFELVVEYPHSRRMNYVQSSPGQILATGPERV